MLTCYPATKPVRSAVPTFEPITLKEAKHQCDIAETIDAFDDSLNSWIKAARVMVERDAGIVCCTGTYTWKLTEFPYGGWFELPRSIDPITAVGSITYPATDGTQTTWAASNYSLDTGTVCPIVKLAYNSIWPTVRGDINGVIVTMTAGYTTQALVIETAKQACKLLVGHWREHRGIVGQVGAEIAVTYESLIDNLRQQVYA